MESFGPTIGMLCSMLSESSSRFLGSSAKRNRTFSTMRSKRLSRNANKRAGIETFHVQTRSETSWRRKESFSKIRRTAFGGNGGDQSLQPPGSFDIFIRKTVELPNFIGLNLHRV